MRLSSTIILRGTHSSLEMKEMRVILHYLVEPASKQYAADVATELKRNANEGICEVGSSGALS